MNLKTNLQKLTRDANITPTELARLTGVSKSVLHRFFNDDHINPTLDTLNRLSAFFKLSIDRLIGNLDDCYSEAYVPILSLTQLVNKQSEGVNHAQTKSIKMVFENRCLLSSNAFGLVINNEFKNPFFLPGSTLIFDPSKQCNDQNYILYQHHGESTVHLRQLIKLNDHDYVKSLNSDFNEIVESLPANKIIIGVLVIIINQNIYYNL